MLYRVVLHVALLIGLEYWILLGEMEKTVEGYHAGLLH